MGNRLTLHIIAQGSQNGSESYTGIYGYTSTIYIYIYCTWPPGAWNSLGDKDMSTRISEELKKTEL